MECHLIVVTVNAKDTSNLVEKLHGILQDKKNIPIFSLQRGVRSSSLLKDELVFQYVDFIFHTLEPLYNLGLKRSMVAQ